ncbi:hypothetical protein [Capnocytophaga sp. CM59]|uniref:hypothetical protein n=1 Tax=Capnocytophaga sp. CM59 TaxID=936370 RepID=UPI00027C64F3|nr:hypothetical protein [Capnocytophaga sp. CM59]EJU32314.1 hypothetical protein HMPREF1154_2570 [Capnocytophaga sp. CM59]
MKLDFYTTKSYTYIVADNVTFRKREQGYPRVNEVPFERVESQNFTSLPIFSIDIEGDVTEQNIIEAYTKYCEFCKNAHQEKKKQNEQAKQSLEADFRVLENEIKEGKVFDANLENIRRILLYLNSMNWGVWQLPKMTCGYSAHQYDCDGHQASTITLDKPIDYYGEKVSKFKVGGGRLHLTKYKFV